MGMGALIGVAAIVVILAILAAGGLAVWGRARADAREASLRQELQAQLAAHSQAVSSQLSQLTQLTTQQLAQVSSLLQRGLSDSGLLVSRAQEAVATELRTSQQILGDMHRRLGEVLKTGAELSEASKTLQVVLSGAKTRGSLGEVTLERMLADALPSSAYQFQYRFSTGAVVDAIIRAGEKIVCIDSKFPLDAYTRLVEMGEDARKDFAQAVRKHADAIAEKYILPNEATLEVALMFVPSEGVYYELLMTEDARAGRLDAYCRGKGIVPVSPNSLYAYLESVLIGLKGLQVQENARRLQASLAGLKKQLDDFSEIYEKLGKHLHNAQQSFEDAESRLGRARGALDQMAQGALPEASGKALEPAQQD